MNGAARAAVMSTVARELQDGPPERGRSEEAMKGMFKRIADVKMTWGEFKALAEADQTTCVETDARLRVEAAGGELVLAPAGAGPLLMNSHSFRQVCGVAQAPHKFVAELPAGLAADVLNQRLDRFLARAKGEDTLHRILTRGELARGVTSTSYRRLWDAQVIKVLEPYMGSGENQLTVTGAWRGELGSVIALTENAKITVAKGAPGDVLQRGITVWGSEVGDVSWGWTDGILRGACSNGLILWDRHPEHWARFIHMGNLEDQLRQLELHLATWVQRRERDFTEVDNLISEAQDVVAAGTREEAEDVLDTFLGLDDTDRAMSEVLQDVQFNGTFTRWALTQGLTALARHQVNADRRMELEAAGGRLLRGHRGPLNNLKRRAARRQRLVRTRDGRVEVER